MAGPTLFKCKEVADALRLSRGSIYRHIETGEIAALRIGSGPKAALRIPPSAIARFLFKDKEVGRV